MSKYLFLVGLIAVIVGGYLLLPESDHKEESVSARIVEGYIAKAGPDYGVDISEFKEGNGKICLDLTVDVNEELTLPEARVLFLANLQDLDHAIHGIDIEELQKYHGKASQFLNRVSFTMQFLKKKDQNQSAKAEYVDAEGKIAAVTWLRGEISYYAFQDNAKGLKSLVLIHKETLQQAKELDHASR